ncbi:MAG: DUF1559 domain-containing protein [Planctomycetaceae bacterium]|nr:DUF1559 domain-containing protein [Planctomycetaceae bacterium]
MQFTLRTFFLLFVVLWSSLATFDLLGIAVFLGVITLAAIVRFFSPLDAVVAVVIVFVLIALLLPAYSPPREAPRRAQCARNLDQIGRSLRAYRAEHGHYPTVSAGSNGKPAVSWRVALLPYLGLDELSQKYDFQQSWNSPKNKSVEKARPEVFCCPTTDWAGNTETNYVAMTGSGTAWDENVGPDSPANLRPDQLILLVEVVHFKVSWTEPRDATPKDPIAPSTVYPRSGIGSDHAVCMHVLCADGAVRSLPTAALKSLPAGAVSITSTDRVDWKRLDAPISNPPVISCPWTRIAALAIWIVSVYLLFHRARRSRIAATKNTATSA